MSTVTTPARNKRWILTERDTALAASLAAEAQLPLVVAELLVLRGIGSPAEAERFLHPHIDHLLDSYTMLGMALAVTRIQAAIAAHEPILIYGDYDVDGTTAVVLLKTAIEMLGGSVRYHVPHRLREGYGMQREILERSAADGVRLVISVDTGIRAFAAAEAAEALGLDLIVTDHHLPEHGPNGAGLLPKALAILNPNQPDCTYASKALCGAGVAFKLAQALLKADADAAPDKAVAAQKNERLRTKLLPSFLKMLAIATVADAVPLLGENRAIVSLGIDALRDPVAPGLRALFSVAQLDPAKRRLTAMDIGFRLAPRINAAGRMDVASDVVELFTTRQPQRALDLAEKLDRLNTERRETEASVLTAVTELLKEPAYAETRCIVLDGEGWHRGIIGILASRVVDQMSRPALVIAHEDGEAYGSGRSVAGFHLLSALESCADLFTRFGGHAFAVGFSLPSANVPLLRERMAAYAAAHLSEEDLAAPVACDAVLPLDHVTPALFRWLRQMEPTGMGNQDAVFIAYGVRLGAEPRYMKDVHMKLQLAQGGASFAALGWRWAERARAMGLRAGDMLDIVYKLRENEHPEYGGLELEIVDLEKLEEASEPRLSDDRL